MGYAAMYNSHAVKATRKCCRGLPARELGWKDNDPKHTSRLYEGYLTKKASDGVLYQMTWPTQSPDLNPIEMVLDELDRSMKESSQQELSICGNSFKTVGKAFQMEA